MTSRVLPSAYVKSTLHNGVGRYVCQLQRLTFKFCKSKGSSRGVRDFIERDVVDFARNNPGVVVYLKPRRHRSPLLNAEYLNGHTDLVKCHSFSRDEVLKHVEYLKNKSGFPIARLLKMGHTDNPSIQGVWTPFTNMDPRINVSDVADREQQQQYFSKAKDTTISATEILRRITEEKRQEQSKSPNDITEAVIVK